MKATASFLVAAVFAVAAPLGAQIPAEPSPTPSLGAPTTAAPTPISTAPDSMTKAVPDAKPAVEHTPRKAVLEKYDLNKNGVLDPDERARFKQDRPARLAEKLKKYDKNGDGKLDAEEKVQMRVDRLREGDSTRKAGKDKQ